MRSGSRLAQLAVALAVVTLAACGDDGAGGTTTQPGGGGAPPAAEPPSPSGSVSPAPSGATPTEDQIKSASLLFDWDVSFTKTGTISAIPDWGEVPDGTVYMISLEVEGICDDADSSNCIQQSYPHFPVFQWTASEPLQPSPWEAAGDQWENTMTGYYVSADYGNGNICIYEWIEAWKIEIVDAVQNGDAWLATEIDGTMRRTERIEPTRSAQAISNQYCTAGDWNQVGDWDVHSRRDLAPTA